MCLVLDTLGYCLYKREVVDIHDVHWYARVKVKLPDGHRDSGIFLTTRDRVVNTVVPSIDPRYGPKTELATFISSKVSGQFLIAWICMMF